MCAKEERVSANRIEVRFHEKTIDSIFCDIDSVHRPGAAIGIAIRGVPVYRRGFGVANMELPILLTPTTRMRVASVTKQFTCLAYLLLCEEGLAELDRSIQSYVPELDSVASEVTMKHLMGHVSGLRDVLDIKWQFSGACCETSTDALLRLYKDIHDANALPGATWRYNNGGYFLLSIAIERITGQTLGDVLRERIFVPLRMYDTVLRCYDNDFSANSAALHTLSRRGGFEKSHFGGAIMGEGGVVSTVDDMLRWLAHMDAPIVGSAETWDLMKTPLKLNNGVKTNYGLGLVNAAYRGAHAIHHPGGLMGGSSHMLKIPAVGLDVAIMVNSDDFNATVLLEKVLDACLTGLDSPYDTCSPTYHGVFRSLATGNVVQLFASEGNQIVSLNGNDVPFVAEGNGVLRPASIWSFVNQNFTMIGDPKLPSSMALSDHGNIDQFVRIIPGKVTDPRSFQGSFSSDETSTKCAISLIGNSLQLRTFGQFGSVLYHLVSLGEDAWRVELSDALPRWPGAGGIIVFGDEGQQFHFYSERTNALRFVRRDTR
jgi:CubicO group peptidase (beta-lactamase class C family)